MLIGLLAKNAILIVEFALERRRTGMAIKYAAILGAGARLRPILMTSLAMVVGLLPLMFASGVGKNGNQTLRRSRRWNVYWYALPSVYCAFALYDIRISTREAETYRVWRRRKQANCKGIETFPWGTSK